MEQVVASATSFYLAYHDILPTPSAKSGSTPGPLRALRRNEISETPSRTSPRTENGRAASELSVDSRDSQTFQMPSGKTLPSVPPRVLRSPGRITSGYSRSRNSRPGGSTKPRLCAAAGASGNWTARSARYFMRGRSPPAIRWRCSRRELCPATVNRSPRKRKSKTRSSSNSWDLGAGGEIIIVEWPFWAVWTDERLIHASLGPEGPSYGISRQSPSRVGGLDVYRIAPISSPERVLRQAVAKVKKSTPAPADRGDRLLLWLVPCRLRDVEFPLEA